MDTTTIILIVLLIVVAAGVAFWYMNNQAATLAEAEAEAEAARLAAITAAAEASAAASAAADADADADADMPPAAGTHPLAGDKYIVVKGTSTGVIVPDSDAAKNFKLDTTGARTSKMVITLEAVEGEADTYYLFAKMLKKYMKYKTGGFNVAKQAKPTEAKSLKPYKIKFTSIGDEYAMSYMDKDDVQMFFGYEGDGAMTSDESVATILAEGLVALEDAGVSSYILTGNFGEENFTAFEIAVDDEEKPTTCIDETKNIEQGCLL
jgi:type II secretory pathway pseudopilin PulG